MTAHRDFRAERRARTRQLIELGGLIAKAGLVERLEDDRAALFGALLMLGEMLDGTGSPKLSPAGLRIQWRQRGDDAFAADARAKALAAAIRREQVVLMAAG